VNCETTILQPVSITKMVYDRIREMLLAGQMKPAEVINEPDLARQLGVSRTPIREALRELSANDLVAFVPRRGFEVVHFLRRDVEEVFDLRQILEVEAVERAVLGATNDQLSVLSHILESGGSVTEARDSRDFIVVNRDFHSALCSISGNERMSKLLEKLEDIVHLMFVEAFRDSNRMRQGHEEHVCILDLIERRKREQAIEMTIEHMYRNKLAVLKYYVLKD
jgi:DNA-binding GntR family transcriptional regulator